MTPEEDAVGIGIGVDGCRAGWCGVRLDGEGEATWDVFDDLAALHSAWYRPGALILVDIPIGLPDTTSHRACDRAARALLGRRASSVFNPPTRSALRASSWEEAARRNEAACGKRLSRQSWALVPKIREVDDFLRRGGPGRQTEVRESHPETLFVVLNGGTALAHRKKDPAGRAERLALLEREHPGVPDMYHAALRELPRRAVARDDVLDALVAAVVAHRYGDALITLPDRPEGDSCGLIQEIVVPRMVSTRLEAPTTRGAASGFAPSSVAPHIPCTAPGPGAGGSHPRGQEDGVVDVLGSVGGTPLVALRRIAPADGARVLVKVEGQNPTGSMKDRMARAVIQGALASGRLSPEGRVVEYTGGSTGTSLAFVCAALGIPITLVTSDAFSLEKRNHMRALGASVEEIPSEGGRTTRALIEGMMARAAELGRAPDVFQADQFNNPDAASGYGSLALELLEQTGGRMDAFVQSVGTAQCIRGVATVLRDRAPGARVVAVEPAESAVLSGGAAGSHAIEGVGPGFVPPMWDPGLADDIVQVSSEEARAMARRLAAEEALFAGISSGANVVAALRVARELGPGRTVVTLLCDSGLKYLSTDLFRNEAR